MRLLLVNACVLLLQIAQIQTRQGPEYVCRNSLKDLIQIWKEKVLDVFLVFKELQDVPTRSELFSLTRSVFGGVLVVKREGHLLELQYKTLLVSLRLRVNLFLDPRAVSAFFLLLHSNSYLLLQTADCPL